MENGIFYRRLPVTLLAVLLLGIFMPTLGARSAGAQEIQDRSVRLSAITASSVSDYTFQFEIPTTSIIGSVLFQFCTNSPLIGDSCDSPAGLDLAGATLDSQSGNDGFSMDSGDAGPSELLISRAPLAGAIITTTYVFGNITNPSTVGQTTFVRISTYGTDNALGPINDSGAVAFVTATAFQVGAFVPPYIRMCVGITVALDCSTTNGDSIDLGNLSSGIANAGQSQFSAGTNSPSGYAVYTLGTTMTSGNNVIQSLSSPQGSSPGSAQFGINLRANTNPTVGQDPSGIGIGIPSAGYDTPNQFVFNAGDQIASSPSPSDFNRMTVSYLVNVSHSQPLGVYSTTITYVAAAQF